MCDINENFHQIANYRQQRNCTVKLTVKSTLRELRTLILRSLLIICNLQQYHADHVTHTINMFYKPLNMFYTQLTCFAHIKHVNHHMINFFVNHFHSSKY